MKKFLRPTKNKVIWSIILFVLSIFLISTLLTFFYDVELSIFLNVIYFIAIWPSLTFAILLNALNLPEILYEWLIIIGGLIIQAFYSYFLVCLITLVMKKSRKNAEKIKTKNILHK